MDCLTGFYKAWKTHAQEAWFVLEPDYDKWFWYVLVYVCILSMTQGFNYDALLHTANYGNQFRVLVFFSMSTVRTLAPHKTYPKIT